MRPVVRHAATAVAALALVLMAVRPERTVTVHPADALLVTPGAPPGLVRRLSDSLGTARVLALAGAESLPDAGYVTRHFGDAGRLHVVGWGLPEDEWKALRVAPASVHATPPPAGFMTAAWPRTLALGEELRVAGTLAGPNSWTYLADGSGVLDSAQTGQDGSFTLVTTPRAAGRQLFTLSAAGVPAETLGAVVTEPPRWRTLLLTAAPSFEAAALRDLLAARGSPVTWRAELSRERDRTEVVNRGTQDLRALDLVVLDGRSLLALSSAERATLQQAVRDSGLGVLLVADAALERAAASLGFALSPPPDTALTERLVRPYAPGGPGGARPPATPVPAEPHTLRETFGARTVLRGVAGEQLAQVRPVGAGHIGVTLVTAPSRWLRAGERATFAAYWAALLAAIAPTPPEQRWTIAGAEHSVTNRPVEIALRARGSQPVAVVIAPSGSRDTVYLSVDALEPDRWVGAYWPRDAGWHEIAGAPHAAWFVRAAAAWPAWQAAERLAATARWAAVAPPAGAARPALTARRPISTGWYLALFVLAAGVLWAERRRAYIRAMPRTAVVAATAAAVLVLAGCGKSEEERRNDVLRCSAVTTEAELIAVCLMTEHKWKEPAADSAGKVEAHRLDSLRLAQEALLWNSDSVRHKAALKTCNTTNDVKDCLLRQGWPTDRATRAADSLWARNATAHSREVKSCARAKGPIASCLMLNYKWHASRAMATEDSVRRARLR